MRTRVFAVRPPCVNNPEKKEPLAMEPASAVLASRVVEDFVAELSLVAFSSDCKWEIDAIRREERRRKELRKRQLRNQKKSK